METSGSVKSSYSTNEPLIHAARIIICGGRHFDNYEHLESVMNEVMSKIESWSDVIEIVSGHCEGADQLGELYASNHGLPCKVFPAQWEKYGRSAGPIRNSEMVKYASEAEMPVVVAFRSPRTKGMNDTVKKATKLGFKVFVYDYDKGNSLLNVYSMVIEYQTGKGK